MHWVPRWLGVVHAQLTRSFGSRPFSSAEARKALGKNSSRTNLALSRLAQAGWLGRLAQGWYVSIPSAAIRSAMVSDWDIPWNNEACYSALAVAVGGLLEKLGHRRPAIALFGSTARHEYGPESDIDLLVVADFESDDPKQWMESLEPIRAACEAIAFRQWKQTRVVHSVHFVPFRPEQLVDPGPLFLDLTEDAILIEDPQGVLADALGRLRARLKQLGARRLRDSQGFRYWELRPGARAGEVVEV
jgi:uncharacterized protein